jgi:4-hydroxy-tetrahydrodipicolinate synthase
VGFKDSENTAGRPEALAAALGGSDRFALMMGVSAHSARALRLGMDGLVPSSGNLAPRLWRTLWDEAGSGRWEAVDGLQSRLDEVAALFQKGRSLGQALAALKGAMSLLGLCQPAMLPPLRGLAGAELDALGDGLRALAARVPELDRAGGTARA